MSAAGTSTLAAAAAAAGSAVALGCCIAAKATAAASSSSPTRSAADSVSVVLYYKYVAIEDVSVVIAWVQGLAAELGLLGRVLIAAEGVNGTLSGPSLAVRQYIATMSAHSLFGDIVRTRAIPTTTRVPEVALTDRWCFQDWKTSLHDEGSGSLPFPDLRVHTRSPPQLDTGISLRVRDCLCF